MNKFINIIVVSALLFSCKGPGSGPLVKESFETKEQVNPMTGEKHQGRVLTPKSDIKIEPCADCIPIGKLLADKKSFSGKVIKVKGQVTKVNNEIMGKNWVHIQDGTGSEDVYDLTVTTSINAEVGQTITFEGKIALDKDFGYGYFYNVLMEDGKFVE